MPEIPFLRGADGKLLYVTGIARFASRPRPTPGRTRAGTGAAGERRGRAEQLRIGVTRLVRFSGFVCLVWLFGLLVLCFFVS